MATGLSKAESITAFDTLPALATRNTNANGRANYIYTSTTTAGTVTLAIKAGKVLAEASIEQVAGDPTSLQLYAAPNPVNPYTQLMLTAVVMDLNNNPVPGQTINFNIVTNISGGTLGSTSAVTDLNGEASVTYTAGSTNGIDTLRARITGVVADTVDLVVDSNAVMVGSVTVVYRRLDASGRRHQSSRHPGHGPGYGGQPIPNIAVAFEKTLGTITSPVITDANGIAQTILVSSTTSGTATVTASAGGFRTSASVAFLPGAPDRLRLNAAPSTVHPDGTSTVTATLLDVNGNPDCGGDHCLHPAPESE